MNGIIRKISVAFLVAGLFAVSLSASELEVVEEMPYEEGVLQEKGAQRSDKPDGQQQVKPKESLLIKAEENGKGSQSVPRERKTVSLPLAVPVIQTDEPTRYTLGPEDVIEIMVRRHGEFSGRYPINGEGKIQYKFVGDIEVAGLTKTEVKERITKILSHYIINPDVDVSILDYRSKVIYVIGEVGAPGKYYMKSDKISLREAVVQAGLPTLAASMRRTQLIRPDKSGQPKESKVDLYSILYEGKLNLDLDMLPGDVLVVPATLFAKIARILNPIASPVLTGDSLRRAGTGGI